MHCNLPRIRFRRQHQTKPHETRHNSECDILIVQSNRRRPVFRIFDVLGVPIILKGGQKGYWIRGADEKYIIHCFFAHWIFWSSIKLSPPPPPPPTPPIVTLTLWSKTVDPLVHLLQGSDTSATARIFTPAELYNRDIWTELYYVHATIKPLIYFIVSAAFRSRCIKLLCCCFNRQKKWSCEGMNEWMNGNVYMAHEIKLALKTCVFTPAGAQCTSFFNYKNRCTVFI